MESRKVLLKRLQIIDFILYETALFLDTHPTDSAAVAYFKKYKTMQSEVREQFVKEYGPITHMDFTGEGAWNWVDEPWPWEREA